MRWRFAVLVVALLAVAMAAAAQDATPPERVRTVARRVAPTYPDLARRLRMSGVVKLRVTVAASGNVKSIEVLGGNPVLITAAQDAVINWKFASAAEETRELIELRFSPH